MKNIKMLILAIIASGICTSVNATKIIDNHRVYNPKCNESVHSFNGLVTNYNYSFDTGNLDINKIENSVLDWIKSSLDVKYLMNFNPDNFYWQFTDNGSINENSYCGVILIIPETTINPEFYTNLGSGLRIPGQRISDFQLPWINDGEIFSFVVNTQNNEVCDFTNWRFECDMLDEKDRVYYSDLSIGFESKKDRSQTTIYHYVGYELRDTLSPLYTSKVRLPIGLISTLVFYQNDQVVGVLCYDMNNIRTKCPVNYTVDLFFDETEESSNILYASPKCKVNYTLTALKDEKSEELINLYSWIFINFFDNIGLDSQSTINE